MLSALNKKGFQIKDFWHWWNKHSCWRWGLKRRACFFFFLFFSQSTRISANVFWSSKAPTLLMVFCATFSESQRKCLVGIGNQGEAQVGRSVWILPFSFFFCKLKLFFFFLLNHKEFHHYSYFFLLTTVLIQHWYFKLFFTMFRCNLLPSLGVYMYNDIFTHI